jgi:hypothetical protein
MHEYHGLGERLVAEPVEGRRDDGTLAVVRCQRQVTRQEPFREQPELAHQELAVVGRQLRDGGGIARLQEDERIHGVGIQRPGIGPVAERFEVMLAAEVAHQHESLLGVHRDHLRHVHTGCGEDARDPQPRLEAFALGRRIHRDLRHAAAVHAEISPETRVGGCGHDALDGRAGQARDPSFQTVQPRIGVVVRSHAEATAGVPAL